MGDRRPSLDFPEQSVSLLFVEHAARSLRRRMGAFLALSSSFAAAVFVTGIPSLPLFFAVWILPALHGFLRASRIVHALDEPGATATRRGATITLVTARHRHQLSLTPDELADARRHVLPPASATIRHPS
jgi:hypothetical protein